MNHARLFLAVAILWSAVATIAFADTFTVINTDDTGTGSLRQAITDANNRFGLDTIAFNIPGTGVHTITPVTQLPSITSPVALEGYTQPGSSVNTQWLECGDSYSARRFSSPASHRYPGREGQHDWGGIGGSLRPGSVRRFEAG